MGYGPQVIIGSTLQLGFDLVLLPDVDRLALRERLDLPSKSRLVQHISRVLSRREEEAVTLAVRLESRRGSPAQLGSGGGDPSVSLSLEVAQIDARLDGGESVGVDFGSIEDGDAAGVRVEEQLRPELTRLGQERSGEELGEGGPCRSIHLLGGRGSGSGNEVCREGVDEGVSGEICQ